MSAEQIKKGAPPRGIDLNRDSKIDVTGRDLARSIILSLGVLILSMLVPVVFLLAMDLEIHATHDITPMEIAQSYAMSGAMKEKLNTTTSTDYMAEFVPSKLTSRSFQFTSLAFFYGPVLLTGTEINLVPDKTAREAGFSGYAKLVLSSIWPVVAFYIALLLLFVILTLAYKKMNQVLKYAVGLSLFWLIYVILLSFIANLITAPVDNVINQVVGRSMNPIGFTPSLAVMIGAPVRVFLLGMIFWILGFLSRRAEPSARKQPMPPRPPAV
jgi:hypothetical protein